VLLVVAVLVVVMLFRGTSRQRAPRSGRGAPATTSSPDGGSDPAPAAEPADDPRASHAQAATLSGTVLERSSRSPVSGAHVFACDPLRQRSVPVERSAVTDDQGRFSLATIGAGDSHVEVVAEGFMATIVPMPGATSEILLDRGLSITGSVVDDEGAPVADARVWAHRDGNQAAWPGLHASLPVGALAQGGSAKTEPDGTFRIDGLNPGRYSVRAAKAGWCFPGWSEPPGADAGARDVELRLWPTHTLVVEHRDKATGERVRCAEARLSRRPPALIVFPIPGDLARGETVLDSTSQGFDPETATTRITFAVVRTRCNTEWDVRQFPPQMLLCVAPGYTTFRQEIVARGAGETRVLAAMEQKRPGAAGAVRLEARFAGSNLAYDGILEVTIDEGTSATRGTSVLRFEDGVAATPVGLPPGDYKARAAGHGDVGNWWMEAGPRSAFTMPAGAEEIRVRLELRGNPVRLEVRDTEGRVVRGYDLAVDPWGVIQRWDTPANHVALQRWREGYAGPDLYVPPGEAKLSASLAGMTSDIAGVTASGDGSPIALTLTLR
jgi:hypothetical protein